MPHVATIMRELTTNGRFSTAYNTDTFQGYPCPDLYRFDLRCDEKLTELVSPLYISPGI